MESWLAGSGDIKPARMAKVYLLSWKGKVSAGSVYVEARRKAVDGLAADPVKGSESLSLEVKERLNCLNELMVYVEALTETLD